MTARAARHLIGYALIALMVWRGQTDWATLGLGALVVLVFDLPGVSKLYALARRWVGRKDSCDRY